METINIVFSSDNNYAQYMGVAICSIFENKTCQNPIDIYVLDGGINDDNKNKLAVLENRYNFKINYIKIDTEFFKDFYISKHLSQATYYRLILPKILPNLDKVLYLDCDIIVIGDLKDFYNIKINDYYLAAVDEEEYPEGRLEKLGILKEDKYFNSGVMLINLNKWREKNISRYLLDAIKSINFEAHDQDALNFIMKNKWLAIDHKFNFMTSFRLKYKIKKEKILIIHYIEQKPWDYKSINPFNRKYFQYLKMTPWKDKKYINKNIKNMVTKFLIKVLPKNIVKLLVELNKKLKNLRQNSS